MTQQTEQLIKALRDTANKGVSVWGGIQIEASDVIEAQAQRIERLEWENKGIAEWRDEWERMKDHRNALRAELDAIKAQEPYCWIVAGVSRHYTGEFAEADTKAEARRIGGTCAAHPLYRHAAPTKPAQPLLNDDIDAIGVDYRGDYRKLREFARAIEAAHGIKGEQA
jgi:hypothetical protein